MARASFLIQPSIAPETFGMAIAEAYCQNLPVIASRIGALAEIVQDDATGLLFSLGDAVDLATKVRWADQHPEEMRGMGVNARRVYEERYSPDVNFRQLTAIYERALEQSRSKHACQRAVR
jgi:glycosyltransferase involved in cell wall biosynthesis